MIKFIYFEIIQTSLLLFSLFWPRIGIFCTPFIRRDINSYRNTDFEKNTVSPCRRYEQKE